MREGGWGGYGNWFLNIGTRIGSQENSGILVNSLSSFDQR